MKKVHIDAFQGTRRDGQSFGFLWTKSEVGMFFCYPLTRDGFPPETMTGEQKQECIDSLEYDEEGWKTGAEKNMDRCRAAAKLRKYLNANYDSRSAK